jgi:hypothetical protein
MAYLPITGEDNVMISEKHAHHFSRWTKERLAKIDATGALPSYPTAAGFKVVQDRAMQIAMENAESAFTFAGKISNALTPKIL